jgi:hypothetical protein
MYAGAGGSLVLIILPSFIAVIKLAPSGEM